MTGISVQIELSADVRERWEKFIYDRGYAKGAFVRSFIEAVTDPVRGPQIERVIQNREPAPVWRRNKKRPPRAQRRII